MKIINLYKGETETYESIVFCESDMIEICMYNTIYQIPKEKALELMGVMFAYYNCDMGEMGNVADAMEGIATIKE